MSEWKCYKLSEISSLSNGINFDKSAYTSGVKLIGVSDFKNRIHPDYDSLQEVDSKVVKSGDYLEKGDIVFVRSNGNKELVGRCMMIDRDVPVTYSGFCIKLRLKDKKRFEPVFFNYLFRTRHLKKSMTRTAVGANIQNLSQSRLGNCEVNVPDIETQKRIATILSRYDSLIENYQKQIKLLEEAAQRLYKEWFIDLHFPGHENTKIVDGLPEGWEKKKVGEIAIISAGGDKPDVVTEEQTTECQVPIYSNGTTKEGLYGYTNKSSNTAGSITVSARGSIGFACLRMHDYFSIVRLISIKPQNNVDLMYLFQFTKVHTFMSNGAAQQQLTVPMVKAIDVVYPAESLLEAFENVVLPLYKKVQSLQSQLRLLTEARDRLLPKLMSGEITV